MRIPNANQLLRLLALLTLLAAGLFGALSLRAPIDDPDLWWHLAAGEQLLRDRALPAEDSFTHTWSGESSSRLRVILTSSWLSELLFQLVFRCCSWQGLLLLRVLIVLSLVASLVWRMWAERTAPALAVSVLGLGLIAFFGCYRLDRPQLLSFLFASLLLALLERVRRGHPPSWWLLPLMLLWSNAHGGYVFGVAVLVLFGLGTALQFRSDRPRVLRLLGWAGSGALVSLLNPAGPGAFLLALSYRNERFASFIAEWKSTWQAYQNGESDVLALWLLIALCLLGLALRRPLYLPDLLIVGFSAYFACAHLRSVAFFAVALAPTTAYYLDRGLLRRLGRRSAVAFQSLAALGVLCALLLGAWQLRQRPGQQLLDPQLPVAVADFIEQAPLMGRMFNHYDWGGYLLWRLSPERRVFIDGRSLDLGVLEDYITIASALDSGSGGWRRLLERHRVDYVVLPLFQTNGLIPPLAKVLLVDRQWTPIYLDHLALVFLRRDPAHRPQLEQYGRSTSEFASQWLSRLDGFVAGNPGDPRMYLARGELRLWLNQRALARQDFVRGLALDPGNRYMSYYLQLIERGAPSGG